MDDTKLLFSDEENKHTERIERLSAHKRRTVALLQYANSTKTALTISQKARYADCHSFLTFHNYFTLGKIKLSHVEHCDIHLLCPLCAIRRASKKTILYEKKVQELLSSNPNLNLYYVVLTVKNEENLSKAYEHLTQAQKTLTQRRRDAQKFFKTGNKKHLSAANSVFARVEAGAYSIEVKRGKNSGDWHPHTNFVLLSEDDIKKEELINEWRSITGNSFIVHCEKVASRQDIIKVLVEIFKYAMKFSEMEFSDNLFAWETLKGRRLTGSFGQFRGLDVEDDDDGDHVPDGTEYEEIFYRFFDDKYKKIQKL
jgi:plasmid rolling circle replication initiator protein Rep